MSLIRFTPFEQRQLAVPGTLYVDARCETYELIIAVCTVLHHMEHVTEYTILTKDGEIFTTNTTLPYILANLTAEFLP
jgi:hypothetical protein